MLHSSMTIYLTEMSSMNQSTDHQYVKLSTMVIVNNHRYYFFNNYSVIAICTW